MTASALPYPAAGQPATERTRGAGHLLRSALAWLVAVALLAGTGTLSAAPAAAAADAVKVARLLVEKKSEPVGIDVDKPRLSWIVEAQGRDVRQASYRVRVAESRTALDSGALWDTGTVTSSDQQVDYSGPQLKPTTEYAWRVDVSTNVGTASSTSKFVTGLFDEDDWGSSAWIGNDRPAAGGDLTLAGASWIHPPYTGADTPPGYFRKTFAVDASKTVRSAELVMAGDIGFSAYLNGTQVASGPSTPDAWRTAARTVVQPAAGTNLLAVRLNNTAKAFGAVVGKLTVRYADGTSQDIRTDGTWLSNVSPQTGWHLAAHDTAGWVPAAARAEFGSGPWGQGVSVPASATADTRMNFDTASWIVPPIGAPGDGNSIPSTLFRRSIEVPSGKQVAWAQLAVTGDQIFAAYWNGTKVASNTGANNEWQSARAVNVQAQPGRNVLALSLTTPGKSQYGGVLARVRIGYTDGTSGEIVTDAGFKSLVASESGAPQGWTTAAFDDTAWKNAQAQSLYRGWIYGDRVTVPDVAVGSERLTLAGAKWIWTPEATAPVAPAEDRAFRTSRTSPAGKAATRADVLITADDSFRLWVNGKLLGATEGATNEWQQSHLYRTELSADRNVFAVRTTNGPGSPAGLIAVVRVHYSDGTSATFSTGTDWKASKTVPDGFQAPDFDDSSWGQAAEHASYGAGPWGSGVRPPAEPVRPAPLLRREFEVKGPIRLATLHVAAGGYADVSLNGSPVSKDVLSPGFTDYDDSVQYVSNDVTGQLKAGRNALGMELGRGFYGMTGGNVWRWQSPPWHDEPVARAVLRIQYEDGRADDIVTDDSWRIADGPTVFDDLYAGETYDASLVRPDYDTTGFDDRAWAPASEVRGPRGELVNQRQQPIRVTESLPAVGITEPVPGTYVVKFPRVVAGWVQFTAQGAAGTTIRAQYGERLRPNGLPDFSNNGGFASGFQTDRFVLAGTGSPETWEPKFSYKGFQYLQVTGWPGDRPPPLDAFTAKVVHTDAPGTGTFESSNAVMNGTHRAVVDTLYNNIHSIPTDTPMFEKNGWTGDAAVGAEMFLLNMDVHELFAKWMRDVHETRDAQGAPMVIAPSSGNWGEWGVAPPWHSAYVMIPRWLHQYGGDERVMAQLYAGMKQYVDLEYNRAPGGIVADPRLGDWVSPEASPAGSNAPEDTRVSGTAYLYTMLTAMQRTAEQLGKPADAEQFAARAAQVKTAFNAAFLDQARGLYRGNSRDSGYRQTHNVLALAFGLAPDAATAQRVADSIAADVVAKGNKLNTGVLGTKYLLPVLTDHGHADLAHAVAVQTGYPSWGYMLENGATSMWEHWSLDARSRGHYFLGTVDDWFYKYVAGIQASERTGYRDVTIAPAVTRQLHWARATTDTPFGPVTSDWRNTNGTLELKVTVPVGSTATVRIPAKNTWAVTESGGAVADARGVRKVQAAGGAVSVEIGSGTYSFRADPRLGQVGDLIAELDAAAATVDGLAKSGRLNAGQAGRLTGSTDTARTAALDAVAHLRRDDALAAARSLARARTAIDEFAAAASRPPADPAGAPLAAAASGLRASTDSTISSLLRVTAAAAATPAAVSPGGSSEIAVSAANAGPAVLRNVRASFLAPAQGWTAAPAATQLAQRLGTGESARADFTVTAPASEPPGARQAHAAVTYNFEDVEIRLLAPVALTVDSAVSPVSVTAEPAAVRPGAQAQVRMVVRNTSTAPVEGRLTVAVPEGWATPQPGAAVRVPAGTEATATVTVTAPRNAPRAVAEYALAATFGSAVAPLATGTATLRVEIAPEAPNVPGYDYADLGDSASEQAHRLAASPSSGTSSEAGLTRRYAGHLTPFSSFEFDMAVVPGQPFVIRATETYDRAQTKRYKVYIDGREALLRTFERVGGGGTETYEFVAPEVPAGASVRVKFENQDDPTYYDPSIADVWTLPATTP